MERKIKIRGLGRWFIPLTIVIMAFWVYGKYEHIAKMSLQQGELTTELMDLGWYLPVWKTSLNQQLLRSTSGNSFDPLDGVEITSVITEWDYEASFSEPHHLNYEDLTEEEKDNFTKELVLEELVWRENEIFNYGNLHYFALNHNSESIISKNSILLEQLVEEELSEDLFQELVNEYRHVIVYSFNEQGEETISLVLNQRTQQEVESAFREGRDLNQSYEIATWYVEDLYFQGNFNSTTFIFGIPHVLTFEDALFWNRNSTIAQYWFEVAIPYVTLAAAVVAVISFLTPLKVASELALFKIGLRLPLEIMPFYLLGVLLIPINSYSMIISETLRNNFPTNTGMPVTESENVITLFVHGLNIGIWTLILGSASFLIIYLKHLFKQGFKGSLKNNSFIVKNLLKIIQFFTVDLKEPATKFILFGLTLQFMFINFIFLPLAANSYNPILFFVGGIVLGIYSMVLFFIFRHKVTSIRSQYLRLFEMTSEMSKGNLEIQIKENLGIFDSMKHQLAQIKTGFKKAVENETTSQRMKTELITNVSHDLKTPLTSIITYTDLLKDETLDADKRKQYLLILEQKSNRLKMLIEDLFEMSKVSSGDINLELVKVDVVALMKQTLMELEYQIQKSELIIRSNFPEKKIPLMLDGRRTYRVFENLIMNIVKYALPKTRAYIDIIEVEDKVSITFRNISASEINIKANELTERFVRGDKSRYLEGSGLGLAIAKTLVELQDGTFDIFVDGDLFKVIITFNLA